MQFLILVLETVLIRSEKSCIIQFRKEKKKEKSLAQTNSDKNLDLKKKNVNFLYLQLNSMFKYDSLWIFFLS